MYFTDVTFLAFFLPITLLSYHIASVKAKPAVIAFFSLAFYLWADPIYLPVMASVAAINYLFGYLICKRRKDLRVRKRLYITALAFDATSFFFFYLATTYFERLRQTAENSGDILSLGAPLGFVFLILSCISYIVDVYRMNAPLSRSLLDYTVYIFFFPKLFAGPVCEYNKFYPELKSPKSSVELTADGIELFVCGFAKKMLLADNIGALRATVLAQNISSLSALSCWLGAFAVLFEIYFDFTGYMDMARGLGKMFGVNLPINYRAPLASRSLLEFFSRYQITVIHWIKRYLASLVVGKGKAWELFRVWVVCIVFALLVGGSENAFFAAFYFFAVLALEKLFLKKALSSWPKLLRRVITILLVLFGFLFYSLSSISDIFLYLKSMIGLGGGFATVDSLYLFSSYWVVLLLCILFGSGIVGRYLKRVCKRYPKVSLVVKPIVLILLFGLSFAFSVSTPTDGFICIYG